MKNATKKQIPRDEAIDSSYALFMEGYQFIQNRCQRYRTDIFLIHLLGQNVICMSGEDATKLFYDNTKFKRQGAAPKRIQKSLFGEHGVQAMDGVAHEHRKRMFMSIMTPDNLNQLSQLASAHWQICSMKWKNQYNVVLYDEAQKIMCKTACQWAGVPLNDKELYLRASDLGKMVDAFGALGPRYWQGKCARKRTEGWMKDIITQVRTHKLNPAENTALYIISWHRDLQGKRLDTQIAAVELINILRPIVAIATYITFGALAIYQYPEYKLKLQDCDENYRQMFVEEVRRYYPFAPFVGARVKSNFRWKGYSFRKDTLVLLDIYGTNHDQRLWRRPNEFLPERFYNSTKNQFDFIPQGGGEYHTGHRCAGEWATVEIMKVSFDFLVNYVNYKVPKQDLHYSMRRMPTLPKSRFLINNVKRIN